MALLHRAVGDSAREINSGCCGMAGSFGHEKEHYDIAKAIAEQRLFPAIRGEPKAVVAVSGFSCRQQIEHHTGRAVRHLVQLLG
jgi:Fe-S oxidoreductase